MFSKILIANRGEIACRIMKTARAMGIRTVAVFSDADRDALHVQMADEAVAIGPAPAAQSYLSIENIVAACRQTGAEAVHPGYGFLSERAAFAAALQAAGVIFIGPNLRAIETMGDKIEAKKAAGRAGVSIVPGFPGVVDDADHAIEVAKSIGFPVMIKASAGGGGKGMRVAHGASDVREEFASARSEAAAAFGDDRIFVEKFIAGPRHIEIQVLGDKHGAVVHLGERECSLQRRNQKVIEEAPSPLLDAQTRRRMGEQAVALARAVGYDSAGTVEFIVGQDGSFYFLEMNTRLQVEHPVTELVTGVDLVEQMIRVAAGERLGFAQADVKLDGWAIESRIYAEDPARNFLPSVGRLTLYRSPCEGSTGGVAVRIDTGVVEGAEISIHYDPMIAKLVTHAPTRAAAIEAQAEALDAFAIDGVSHNLCFLAAVMAHPRWKEGRLSTDFIADEFPGGFTPPAPEGEAEIVITAAALSIDYTMDKRRRMISGQLRASGPAPAEQDRVVMLGGRAVSVRVAPAPAEDGLNAVFAEKRRVRIKGEWRPGDPLWRGLVDGRRVCVNVRAILNGAILTHGGASIDVRVFSRREAELYALMPSKTLADAAKQFLCPMPGVLKMLAASPGQAIKAGEPLAIVEAMKMENLLRAERDGIISRVCAREGDSLAIDAVILEFD